MAETAGCVSPSTKLTGAAGLLPALGLASKTCGGATGKATESSGCMALTAGAAVRADGLASLGTLSTPTPTPWEVAGLANERDDFAGAGDEDGDGSAGVGAGDAPDLASSGGGDAADLTSSGAEGAADLASAGVRDAFDTSSAGGEDVADLPSAGVRDAPDAASGGAGDVPDAASSDAGGALDAARAGADVPTGLAASWSPASSCIKD